ncbi:MAG TPA: tetratricopeptide repeat protein, partial [Isosphaeraceae bacterium]|nr:tetratricopeptide repeat protein [Isosphaeraceae bacterium]
MGRGAIVMGLLGMLCAGTTALGADSTELAEAHQLWQTGKYPQAQEVYDALIWQPTSWSPDVLARIALGQADCLASQGHSDEAIATLKQATALQPENADVWAHLADLQLGRGDWDGAEASARKAVQASPDHLLAHWVQARLLEGHGQREAANDAWKWFVDHYNGHRGELAKNAEGLLIVGQAAERYYRATARGQELKEQLVDVITELYEGALRADSNCWQSPWLVGRLYLSGYNERDGLPELQRALTINPLAVEVLVTLGQADLQGYKLAGGRTKAERALEINPEYGPAHVLLADLNISDERFNDALAAARKAVAANPKDEQALARLAAADRLLVDPVGAWAVETAALAIDPRPVDFYAALGERLGDRRKYHEAERALLSAVAADPKRADVRIGLGKLYMEVGREAEAADLFEAAFAADPFNARAENWMRTLKRMATYTPIQTEHYSVLVSPKQDALLGKYMAKFLESIYGELTTRFGYSPPGVTQIEIMDSHLWFSGRTTGQPFIPTVGACTGKVVALASPASTRVPFNWSRVLKHEVTHVITLQQTDFNIPHWYTEALAVESEGSPRPQPWNKLLLERVPGRTGLLNLDTINLGFIRPKEADDRQLAYCQSQLYARYMLKRFGPDALIKMLGAYRRGLTTDRAIKECFNVEKADFEAKYLEYLDEVVKTIRTRIDEEKPVSFSRLERMLKEKPDDPDLNARMAYEHFVRRDLREARPFADKALKLKSHHPLASYVKARLLDLIGDADGALAVLEPALDPDRPDERVIDLLAELKMKAGDLAEAERLYELARKDDPFHSKWIAGLAR